MATKIAKKAEKKQQKQKRVVLLDTHAILHRAYHALPDFSSSKGEPTGALYGLTTMLLRSINDLKPDYLIATRDRAEKTHRHEVYEDYKATRMKTDEALVEQIIKAPEIFKAFGIPVYDAAGYEADDMIGTISKKLKKKSDIETIIVTGDMDMLQLIDDGRVEVYRLLVGITNLKFYDEAAVKEKFGFGPEFVPDLKGIMGDASDNIKGVPGVGEGSALKLIQTFGGLDDIYKALKKDGVEAVAKKAGIQTRYAQLMNDNKEAAMFSRQLATITCDAPIDFSLPDHPWKLEDHADGIIKMCDDFEFRSIRERVKSLAGSHEQESSVGEESTTEEKRTERKESDIDPIALRETSIGRWLLLSDVLNPSLDDILQFAHTDDFEKARETVFKKLRETGRLMEVYEKIERPLIPVVNAMNEAGVQLDVPYLKKLSKEYAKGLAELAGRIYQHAGHEFNINSPKQLGDVLYDELKINAGGKQKKTAGGARTTREDELVKLKNEHAIIGDVLAYRELQKLLGTYIDKMPALVGKDGRLRSEFVQAGSATGRMSCQDPNLQNIPIKSEHGRRIRVAFQASKGNVLAAIDYSQIELRIAAGLSGDEKLTEVFRTGGDVHTAVAAQVFGVPPEMVDREMRRRAKVINFGILYGMGVNALRANLGESVSRDEAAKFLNDYFSGFAGLARYIENTKATAARQGYTETLFGRRRNFPGFKSALPGIRAQAERMAINAPIQGSQADIIKLAMVEADKLIKENGWESRAKLLMQVHDELVYEIAEKDAKKIALELKKVMEGVVSPDQLSGVPIVAEVSIGQNWGTMERIHHH